jgi:predicted lipid-binding transport protein (Tim44 family)
MRYAVLFCIVLIAGATLAEARLGGGRSSGSRGFRGFGSRSSYSSGSAARTDQQPSYSNSYQNQTRQAPPAYTSPSPSRGSFLKGLAGGIAGGFLGSMLFKNLGYAGMGSPGFGGMGILEMIVLVVLGYLVYQLITHRKKTSPSNVHEMSHYEKLRSVEAGPYAQDSQFSQPMQSSEHLSEENNAFKLRSYDSSFNLTQFKDERMDDFLKLQTAWNQRDLNRVTDLIAPELKRVLDDDISDLKNKKRINRLENIAVRGTELVEAWQEYGQEYATLRFRANLVDYTVDEFSGAVVEGDKNQSVKFEEDWTFVRPTGSGRSWKLTAIEN